MPLRAYDTTVTTAGGAGVATIHAVQLDYSNEPATTDVTVKDGLTGTVLKKENTATDAVYYPRTLSSKSADGSAGTAEVLTIGAELTIEVAGGDPAGAVKVTVIVDEL